MKRFFYLLFLFISSVPLLGQNRFIKVGALPVYCPVTYYAVQAGYEQLISKKRSLQVDFRAALGQDLPIYDYNGPTFLYALAFQYRYYFVRQEKTVLNSFYIAPILRGSLVKGKYEGNISAKEDKRIMALGIELGKNIKIGKKMALNPFIGILAARSDALYTRFGEMIIGGVWVKYEPAIVSSTLTYGPTIRLGCNWVFGGGKKVFSS